MILKIELYYAKLNFLLNTQKRMALYRKLSSLLRNNFTLMDALGRLERVESKGGRKPSEPFAIVIKQWQKNLEKGMSFSDSTRGWVPINETLMMTLGDVSKLSVAIENVVRVSGGADKIKRAMLSAVVYPLFLLVLTFGIIIMVGLYLVPPLIEAAGTEIVWRGTAASLVWIADFSAQYWYWFVFGFIGIVLFGWLSMPRWSGKLRSVFDNIPPWNMYKIQVSVGWLMSLAAMLRSGGTVPVSMKMLADNSTKYLQNIIEVTLRFITNGDNLGIALSNSGYNFPNQEIMGDLAIYADMNEFDKNLSNIANDYLDDSVRKMESISSSLNSFGILMVSLIIGWVVFGTFEMQDQITAALM